MPEPYTDYQFRLEVVSPVATDSPFDSDTLWGRILSALFEGSADESVLAKRWLAELEESSKLSNPDWKPPLLISEGFQCDVEGMPWLPIPLAIKLALEQRAATSKGPQQKKIKKIKRIPLSVFCGVCRGALTSAQELLDLHEAEPSEKSALHPHIAMNRASNTGVDGQFHMLACKIYSPSPKKVMEECLEQQRKGQGMQEIAFFVRLRQGEDPGWVEHVLKRVCREGWGKAKSRGLGQIRFKSFEAWQPPELPDQTHAFVSLSHFCPAQEDPTDGYWKLQVKNPVPTQFIDGNRVALGEEQKWAVKSFLRLCAGSCFKLSDNEPLRYHYGRMLSGLLDPALNANGKQLPPLFHYALAFPVPIKWPEEAVK